MYTPRFTLCILLLWSLQTHCLSGIQQATIQKARSETPQQAAIRKVLEEQVEWWNKGNIEKYMESYWKSDSLIFTSGGNVMKGWKETLERYRMRYPTRESMGMLSFSDLEISVLTETTAWVLGKWKLVRENDMPQGVFTLVLRRFPVGWRIVHDHTSSAP